MTVSFCGDYVDPIAGYFNPTGADDMPSKSKAQRAFLIKVVADEDFAKSRKMSQDVARGILDEDDEHIAKDKHWADKLPDRAGESHESRTLGDVWYNPEFVPLLVEQQVHPSFESFSETLKNSFRFLLGSARKEAQAKANPQAKWVAPAHWDAVSGMPEHQRVVKTGTGDISSYISALYLKGNDRQRFWAQLIRKVEEYTRDIRKIEKDVEGYCKKCKAIYKKCETMKPAEARAYAEAEMRKIGLTAPTKPGLPMADFEIIVGPREGTEWRRIITPPQQVVVPYPTQEEFNKLKVLTATLWTDVGEAEYWTLDDTDEIKWWDHHFPNDSHDWGPMINLFPFAGEIKGYDTEAVSWSLNQVTDNLMRLLMAVSDLKTQ